MAICALLVSVASSCEGARFVPLADAPIGVMGRADRSDPQVLRIGFPGVAMRLRFEGSMLRLRAASTTGDSRFAVTVDGGEPRVLRVPKSETDLVLADHLSPGPHTVDVIHRTETWEGIVSVHGFVLGRGGAFLAPDPWPARRLLFIGDSVTCGEGIDRPTDAACETDAAAFANAYASYGWLIARDLQAQVHLVSYGGRGLVRDWRGRRDVLNAPQFFDLALPDEPARVSWDHSAYVPDAIVVSLGTNDFNLALGALPGPAEYVPAYVAFVRAIRAHAPAAIIFLTEGAMVSDTADPSRPQRTTLRQYIAQTVRELGDPHVLAVEANHYPGDACNAHPTREQHAMMARDLEPVIRRAMGW